MSHLVFSYECEFPAAALPGAIRKTHSSFRPASVRRKSKKYHRKKQPNRMMQKILVRWKSSPEASYYLQRWRRAPEPQACRNAPTAAANRPQAPHRRPHHHRRRPGHQRHPPPPFPALAKPMHSCDRASLARRLPAQLPRGRHWLEPPCGGRPLAPILSSREVVASAGMEASREREIQPQQAYLHTQVGKRTAAPPLMPQWSQPAAGRASGVSATHSSQLPPSPGARARGPGPLQQALRPARAVPLAGAARRMGGKGKGMGRGGGSTPRLPLLPLRPPCNCLWGLWDHLPA